MPRLLLASASPARRATLRAAGIDPLVLVSDVDEEALLAGAGPVPAAEAVLLLARAKARAVHAVLPERHPRMHDLLVLGCDSMLELDGQVLGKPSDPGDAVHRWHSMRGRRGVLHTGHWLVDARPAGAGGSGLELGETASTVVHFADLSDAEVAAYVATGEPLVVAGAFTVDGRGGPFVERIEGDHHNVVGLSLPLLRHLLARVTVPLTDLWT